MQSDFFNEDDVMDDAEGAAGSGGDESDEAASDPEDDEVRAQLRVFGCLCLF